jgi:multicomponent Na+:H+ antiporter subunit D
MTVPAGALATAPIVLPLLGLVVVLLLRRHPGMQALASLAGLVGFWVVALLTLLHTMGGAIIVTQMGGWPAPFGIVLVADRLSGLALFAAASAALLIFWHFGPSLRKGRQTAYGGEAEHARHPALQALLAGTGGSFVAGDLFNLYVWFEVLLISSFVLLCLGGGRQRLQGAFRYVALNLVGTACFLLGVGLIYGMTGTLTMADLASRLPLLDDPRPVLTAATLLLAAFGLKAALFPFMFWLPAAYPRASLPVQALFSALLTKIGVYALLRTFTLIFVQDSAGAPLQEALLWMAVPAMLIGAWHRRRARSAQRLGLANDGRVGGDGPGRCHGRDGGDRRRHFLSCARYADEGRSLDGGGASCTGERFWRRAI